MPTATGTPGVPPSEFRASRRCSARTRRPTGSWCSFRVQPMRLVPGPAASIVLDGVNIITPARAGGAIRVLPDRDRFLIGDQIHVKRVASVP